MITSISQSAGSSLQELLRSLRKEQEEMLEQAAAETLATQTLQAAGAQTASAHVASSNVMSRNFFDSNYKRSEYVQASIDDKQLEGTYANKMNSMMNSLMAQASIWDLQRRFGDKDHPIENTYVIGTRLVTTSSQATNRIQREETYEASEKNLDAIKDDIERKAQEAIAPTDADGNPIEGMPTKSTGEAAPMPEISGSNPALDAAAAPAPEVSAAVASTPVPAPEVSFPVVPSTPSIDIII